MNTVQVTITRPQTAIDMHIKILQKSKRRGVQLQKIIVIICIQHHYVQTKLRLPGNRQTRQ